MKALLLPSALGAGPLQYLTSVVINDTIAIDAGSLGFVGSPAEQHRIRHVFLTHAHIDHVASLPIFLENVSDDSEHCPTVYATKAVLDVLRKDILNDRLFPDFVRLSRDGPPLVRLEALRSGRPVRVADLTITAVPIDHIVPTVGYLVDDGQSAFAFVTDTAPTNAIWEAANRLPHLKAVLLEVTFPQSMAWLAEISKHLTPAQFAAEVGKVRPGVPVYAVHLKARFRDQIQQELTALGLPHVCILEPGQTLNLGP